MQHSHWHNPKYNARIHHKISTIIHIPTSQLWHSGKCCNLMYNMHVIFHSSDDGWWHGCLLLLTSKAEYEMVRVIIIVRIAARHFRMSSSYFVIVRCCHTSHLRRCASSSHVIVPRHRFRTSSSHDVAVTLRIFVDIHVVVHHHRAFCRALSRVRVIVRRRRQCHV